jgi:hypothetical protein
MRLRDFSSDTLSLCVARSRENRKITKLRIPKPRPVRVAKVNHVEKQLGSLSQSDMLRLLDELNRTLSLAGVGEEDAN